MIHTYYKTADGKYEVGIWLPVNGDPNDGTAWNPLMTFDTAIEALRFTSALNGGETP